MGESETILTEIERSTQELLQWAKEHPKCTLKELEEEIQKWKTRAGEQLLEAAVAMQGSGRWAERKCACGGEWVFQGYRERRVTTSQGVIRLKRAYFTCEHCGQGFFPLGRRERDTRGVE
jgi:hypothetical protein